MNFDLERIHLHDFPHIKELYLDYNIIPFLSLLPRYIERISVQDCGIKLIQSRLPDTLHYLNGDRNQLHFAGLPLNWGKQLTTLLLSYNLIERFPRHLPSTLKHLTLEGNQLEALPSELPPQLQTLNLRNNRIRSLPSYKRNPIPLVFLDNNCLLIKDVSWAVQCSMKKNWNTVYHHVAQRKICQCWKRYRILLRLRHLSRTYLIKEELLSVSMMPERCFQILEYDSLWGLAGSHTATALTT